MAKYVLIVMILAALIDWRYAALMAMAVVFIWPFYRVGLAVNRFGNWGNNVGRKIRRWGES